MLNFGNITATRSVGVGLDEIKDKKHNIWIGVSFSNKDFTIENIKSLISFALEYTKDKVLIWLPGRMQATNYQYFEGYTRAKALRKAFANEDTFRSEIATCINSFPEEARGKIVVANYDDTCTPTHILNREVLFREFSKEGVFYKDILEVVTEIVIARGRTPSKDKLESLALYLIHELPAFLNGIKTYYDDTFYTAIIYPGMGKLDDLVIKIKTSDEYAEFRLNKKLKLENKTGIVDIEIK